MRISRKIFFTLLCVPSFLNRNLISQESYMAINVYWVRYQNIYYHNYYMPIVLHYSTLTSPITRHLVWSSACRIQHLPAFLRKSSLHLDVYVLVFKLLSLLKIICINNINAILHFISHKPFAYTYNNFNMPTTWIHSYPPANSVCWLPTTALCRFTRFWSRTKH